MADHDYGSFIAKIIETLEKNGYPDKRVSLPLEKMYEVAYEKGLNFNKVLEFLEQKGTCHEKTQEKIIFFPKPEASKEAAAEPPHIGTIMAQAQEMMKNMNPEIVKNIKKTVEDMSPEDRKALVQKAKDMGVL